MKYPDYSPRHTQIDVGETHVTVREPSGRVLVARILERVSDANGRVASLLLDRIVHQPHGRIEGWTASGCYVTELVPEEPGGAGGRALQGCDVGRGQDQGGSEDLEPSAPSP